MVKNREILGVRKLDARFGSRCKMSSSRDILVSTNIAWNQKIYILDYKKGRERARLSISFLEERQRTGRKDEHPKERKRVYVQNDSKSAIEDLPKDMVVKILGHVAASSFDAFFRAKQCCKFFLEASEDDSIYKRITLEEFPNHFWKTPKKSDALVRRCIRTGNPQALYWQGMFEFFSSLNLSEGIALLREAEHAGDIAASYTLGVINLCSDDRPSKKDGEEILKKIHKQGRIVECRERFVSVTRSMWMNNRSIFEAAPLYVCPLRRHHYVDGLWRVDSLVRDDVQCDSCLCHAESLLLYRKCRPVR